MKVGIYNNKNKKVFFNPVWASHLCNTKPDEYSRNKFDLTVKKEEKSEKVEEKVTKKKTTRKKKTTSKKED